MFITEPWLTRGDSAKEFGDKRGSDDDVCNLLTNETEKNWR